MSAEKELTEDLEEARRERDEAQGRLFGVEEELRKARARIEMEEGARAAWKDRCERAEGAIAYARQLMRRSGAHRLQAADATLAYLALDWRRR